MLETEINKLFSFNQSETERHNDSRMYFNGNVEQIKQSAAKDSGGIFGSIGRGFLKFLTLGFSSTSEKSSTATSRNHVITDQVMSETDIQKHISEHAMETEWKGKKLRPKEFKVYKLTDITDHLQIAIITKQLLVDKEQKAIVRVISTMNTPYSIIANHTPSNLVLTGEVRLYSGMGIPPHPWLLCDGSAVSRVEYRRLFSVIGTQYGSGDYVTTFNLPDFRGRVALGIDANEIRVGFAKNAGQSGGNTTHQMKLSQLPAHTHTQGSLNLSTTGVHSHSIYDPGHNHGGSTGNTGPMGSGGWGMRGNGHGTDQSSHSHSISTDYTRIQIQTAGSHTHTIYGETGLAGSGEAFSIVQPYQTIHYIIYAA